MIVTIWLQEATSRQEVNVSRIQTDDFSLATTVFLTHVKTILRSFVSQHSTKQQKASNS